MDEDGAIAVHITNRYLDLEPVVRGAAETFNLRHVRIKNDSNPHNGIYSSDWIILTRNKKLADALEVAAVKPSDDQPAACCVDRRQKQSVRFVEVRHRRAPELAQYNRFEHRGCGPNFKPLAHVAD